MGYVIPPQAIETTRLSGLGRMAEYGKGERIFTKNQEQNFSAFVETGLVYLCAENEQYDRSILSFFRPGDWFSADMLLSIDHGVSYLIAKYPTRLLLFSPEEQARLRQLYPQNSWADRASLAHTYLLQQRTPRQRLMAFFREEARRQGSTHLHLPLPLADLADYLAVDRAAMTRELTRMKQSHLVDGQRRDWEIVGV